MYEKIVVATPACGLEIGESDTGVKADGAFGAACDARLEKAVRPVRDKRLGKGLRFVSD